MHYEIQSVCRPPYISKAPQSLPSCVLVFNSGWNDYGAYTRFCLHYYDERGKCHSVGELKIMTLEHSNTKEVLGDGFDGPLGSNFCSLGMTKQYYEYLCNLFHGGDQQREILSDLRDCAYNDSIYEEFSTNVVYKTSLERDMESGDARIQAKFLLSGGHDKGAVFSFSYLFSPEYLEGKFTKWDVKFLYDAPLFMRSVGLIGENGVGKTQMVSRLVKSLISDGHGFGSIPLFGSCITISSTPLDNYSNDIPVKIRIPYASFSIEQEKVKTIQLISDCLDEISKRKILVKKVLLPQMYQDLISELVGNEVDGLIEIEESPFNAIVNVNKELLQARTQTLSSGQLQTLCLLTCVCAHIHLSTLLVIDEPEVHLHPQLIEHFMASLETLLQRFKSYAIIVTHSPLIVRELVGENVYVMRSLEGNIPHIAKIGLETFGTDASVLYSAIFNYDERVSLIARITSILVRKGFRYEGIVAYFNRFMPALSMDAKLLIRDIVSEYRDA